MTDGRSDGRTETETYKVGYVLSAQTIQPNTCMGCTLFVQVCPFTVHVACILMLTLIYQLPCIVLRLFDTKSKPPYLGFT